MSIVSTAQGSSANAGTALLILAFTNFVVGMGAFVVIGVLSPVASGFAIDKASAGWVMTSYAIAYALASPILVAVTGGADRRNVLLAGLGIFLAGALAAAASPTYPFLLAARAVMALGGALVTPVAASVGVTLAGPANRGKALATVFGGLTLAQVLGVPAGAWLGYAYGWQAAFAVVAALSIIGIAAVQRAIPLGIAIPRTTLATLGVVLGEARLVAAVSFTAFFIGGLYTIYTFLTPFLETRLGLGRDGVTAILVLFGAGAVAGNAMGGWLTDRAGPVRTLVALCLAQVVIMPFLTLVPLSLWPTAATIVLWSICAWSFMVPQQARLAALDPPRTPVLFALNAAAIYVGGSLGSFAGGQVLTHWGMDWLGIGGALIVLAGLASLRLVARRRRAEGGS